jgi:hypothetical protein
VIDEKPDLTILAPVLSSKISVWGDCLLLAGMIHSRNSTRPNPKENSMLTTADFKRGLVIQLDNAPVCSST